MANHCIKFVRNRNPRKKMDGENEKEKMSLESNHGFSSFVDCAY